MNEKSNSPPARRVARCSRRGSPKLRGVVIPGAISICFRAAVGEPRREGGCHREPAHLAPDRAQSPRRGTAPQRLCARPSASTACASANPDQYAGNLDQRNDGGDAEVDRAVAQVAERARNRRDDLNHLAHADRDERRKAQQHHERHRQRRPPTPVKPEPNPEIAPTASSSIRCARGLSWNAGCRILATWRACRPPRK